MNGIFLPRKEIFNFINSFHMPLFFMISGFLFTSSLALNFKEFLRKRFFSMMVPHITWGIIFLLSRLVMAYIDPSRTFNILSEIQGIVNPTVLQFYFLRDLFVTEVLVFLSYRIFKKSIPAFIAVMLFVLLFDFFGVIDKMLRFIMPVFLTGIVLRSFHTSFSKYLNKVLIISGLIFIVCLYFFNESYTIYFIDFPAFINMQQSFAQGKLVLDFTNISISGLRLLLALAGSIFFFTLFQRCWKKNTVTSFFSRLGQLTIGIYILQTTILQNWLGRLIDFSRPQYVLGIIIGLLTAMFVLIVSVLIIRLIQRSKPLTFVLFGSSLVERKGVRFDDKEALMARVAEAQSAEALALEAEAHALEALAAEARIAEARVAEARALEARAAEARSAATRALAARALAARVVEARSAKARVAEARSAKARAAEARALEVLEARVVGARVVEARTVETEALDAEALEAEALEALIAEARAS
jgi:fucose 4-O-acetylase-like acetyltransferase